VAGDREDRAERRLQALIAPLLRRRVGLEELRVRLELRRDEERHLLDNGALRKALADAFTLGQRIGHRGSWPLQLEEDKGKTPKRWGLCFGLGSRGGVV
jgi:hypothetical protein